MKFAAAAAAIAACVVLCDAETTTKPMPVAKKDAFFGTATPLQVGAAEAKWLALTKQERTVTLAATCENEWKTFCPEEWTGELDRVQYVVSRSCIVNLTLLPALLSYPPIDAAPVFQRMYENLVLIAEEKAIYEQEMAERKKNEGKGNKPRALRAPENADGNKPGKGKKKPCKKGGRGQKKSDKNEQGRPSSPQETGPVEKAPSKDGQQKGPSPSGRRHGKCPRAVVSKAMKCFYTKAFDEANEAKVSVDCKVGLVANKVAMARDQREREQDPHHRYGWNAYDATGLVFFLFCACVAAITTACCCVVRKCCLRARAVREDVPSVVVDVERQEKGTPVVVIAQENVPFGVEVKEVAVLQ